ncbi:MAG: hypothetical protein JSR91_19480 [Proteobacteria bacterium]|nr:hypothetical protein [Pseudomonadota bacterium]
MRPAAGRTAAKGKTDPKSHSCFSSRDLDCYLTLLYGEGSFGLFEHFATSDLKFYLPAADASGLI